MLKSWNYISVLSSVLFGNEGTGWSDSAGVLIHVGPLYLVIWVQCCVPNVASFA